MPKKQQFSEQLRRAIEQSDKSRYQLSLETGVPQSNLSRFVSQQAGLSLDSIDRLVENLDLVIVPRTRIAKKRRK